ncbi:hypothetical protein CAOG_08686 [Capsaspora owczarzaki ATCC 30864]|uniref:Transcription elongation factor 1 homolog n=1 Tax=Capsaspora owczarzaki (strain ATCC 30864) TaxID=595528 RepID=A0A0D2UB39_CAPO3|nr:hypothetical protein CAOG_08686 [Capsaspora owczarzaki ATCC 30864]KJE92266.1 hypothetical protein CAOG_008686 [Capsaspora owczarzaki ATCC 30864]|eukprot:XP_011270297.1 hypothetical protein CAOG_08686 [Capsaspora owczarzaki ATCC 30864]
MGRRKSKRAEIKTKKAGPGLETQFSCPFCNHERAVQVKIDLQHSTAQAKCNSCTESFSSTQVNYLTQPVDVFHEWIDACEAANAGKSINTKSMHPQL